MRKEIFRKIMCDPYVIVLVFVGAILMALTLHFGVNPACAAATDEAILSAPFFSWTLFVTTMPAWIAGATVADLTLGRLIHHDWTTWAVIYPLMFIFQIAIYTGFGLLLRWIPGKLVHRNH